MRNLDQFSDLTVFRRFVTGPPGVPDDVQQVQQEAFDSVISNDEFLAEARDATRPLISPETGADAVGAALDSSFDALSDDPYRGLIRDALSD